MLRFDIRPARQSDYPGIIRIMTAHNGESPAPGAFTQWEQRRELDPGYQRLVAAGPGGAVIATGTVRVGAGQQNGNALIQVQVAPALADEGIGQMLHAILEHWAIGQGATHLVAIIHDDGTVTRLKRRWTGADSGADSGAMTPAWPAPDSPDERPIAMLQ